MPLVDTRMPGVYTQEIPTLPPSIAVVQSAVPCFIGYTEKAIKDGKDMTLKAVRIRNMRDYETWFGTSPNQDIEVELREIIDDIDKNNLVKVRLDINIPSVGTFYHRMHYAMQLYYANGGGPCFIISVGSQTGKPLLKDLVDGVNAAKLAKDVTILAFPDAPKALDENEYNALASAALKHCLKMGNRVTLLDVDDTLQDNQKVTQHFRSNTPSVIDEKKYGIAYFPFLSTVLDYKFEDTTVKVKSHHAFTDTIVAAEKVAAQAQKDKKVLTSVQTSVNAHQAVVLFADFITAVKADVPVIPDAVNAFFVEAGATAVTVKGKVDELVKKADDDAKAKDETFDTEQKKIEDILKKTDPKYFFDENVNLEQLDKTNNLLYNRIKEDIRALPVPMPPSPAIAGVYVQTDATQGVWRAPANVSLANVIMPTVEIDDDFHADLNSDATSGKSVNAIRAYEGKGILVFGARTLAGNDLEWRYVSVRRTFCFIEDSIARAMQDFVFSPNTRDTWIKAKSAISNFLNNIWQAGGLFGNTPNEAYSVNVGHPETMGDVDILEGRMIIEIKLRVSRPAEFIILRYEHKFQANAS